MKIAIVDTETTGLSPQTDRVIELAVMLFDTRHASPIQSFACLIKHDSNPAESINRIPVSLLQEHGLSPGSVWRRFVWLAEEAECLIAHRADFDREFVARSIGDVQAADPGICDGWSPEKPWVCSKTDLQWIGGRRGEHLAHLALSLGLGVASAHRAATDVDTIARCLTRAAEMGMDLEAEIRRGMRLKRRFVALVSYDSRDVAKRAGFLWDDQKREWWRMMCPEDTEALTFRVVQRD
jgi:DNA polymerase III subunit epsilon